MFAEIPGFRVSNANRNFSSGAFAHVLDHTFYLLHHIFHFQLR